MGSGIAPGGFQRRPFFQRGFFGGGFGSFIMFLLVILGFTFMRSAAIGRLVGFIMSLISTIVFALYGLIDYTFAISLGLGCAIGSWIGVSIAVKKGNKYIKLLFIIIILSMFFYKINSHFEFKITIHS